MSESKEYSVKHVHFIDLTIPDLLETMMRELVKRGAFSIIDLGCGDGRILYVLYRKGLLKNAIRVVRVDISEERIRRLRKPCPFAEGIVTDVTHLAEISDNFFDAAIPNQVVEHVPDDTKMLKDPKNS